MLETIREKYLKQTSYVIIYLAFMLKGRPEFDLRRAFRAHQCVCAKKCS